MIRLICFMRVVSGHVGGSSSNQQHRYDEKNDTAYFNWSTFSDESEEGWAEETSPGTNQRQQNDADQGQQKGQIGPWDPGIRLAEELDSDHKSTTPSGTSGF